MGANMPSVAPKNQGVKRISWLKKGKYRFENSDFRVFLLGDAKLSVIQFAIEFFAIVLAQGDETDERRDTAKAYEIKRFHLRCCFP